jgi:DNA-binding MarR family transcriptional regulator
MRGHHVATTETLDAQQTASKTYDQRMALVEPELERPSWTFLTNHAHVMVALSRDPELRQRDLAYVIGITPGAVQRILDDLERAGYVKREKVGRRNRYEVLTSESLRHPLEEGHNIGELLEMLHD